jgi:hypothetical protein
MVYIGYFKVIQESSWGLRLSLAPQTNTPQLFFNCLSHTREKDPQMERFTAGPRIYRYKAWGDVETQRNRCLVRNHKKAVDLGEKKAALVYLFSHDGRKKAQGQTSNKYTYQHQKGTERRATKSQ